VNFDFLRNRYVRIVTVLLLIQVFAFYALASRTERVPEVGPLAMFPSFLGAWVGDKDYPIEKETMDILRADDTLDRSYVDKAKQRAVFLFIAFFKTQRYGQAPHSPRNCLPGSGWEPIAGLSSRPTLQEPGMDQPIVINKYVTQRGDEQSVTLYWYQSRRRIIADEFAAKFWSIMDSVRYHRSDTAIVKVTIPVVEGDVNRATEAGYDFVRAMFPALLRQLPQ
jgi:EpsI family protein